MFGANNNNYLNKESNKLRLIDNKGVVFTMESIKITKTHIEGLYVIEPTIHKDDRGYFFETYSYRDMVAAGLKAIFVQDNQTMSIKGVLRGLHIQRKYPQEKLIRVVEGTVFDVAVDMRRNSPTYGQWFGIELSKENKKQLYISKGFAHGYYVTSKFAELCYKVTDFWHPDDEIGIPWNDPTLAINWPIPKDTEPLIAEKDKHYDNISKLYLCGRIT